MKSTKNFEKEVLLSLGALVLFLGVFVVRNLGADAIKKQKTDVAQHLSRGPASIEMIQEKLPAYKFSKSLSVVLTCDDEHSLEQVFGSHLRLLGTKCYQSTQVIVRNVSNGYTATIFDTAKDSFTTDFIELSSGENVIEIEHLNNQGILKKNKLKINRAVASEE